MHVQRAFTLLLALLPTALLAKPLLNHRTQTEPLVLTFFTPSTPRCSRHTAATYSEQHYAITSLGKCQDLVYDLGSPYKNVEVTEVSPDFAKLGAELTVYEKWGCEGEIKGRVTLLQGKVVEGQCAGIKAGRSAMVDYAEVEE